MVSRIVPTHELLRSDGHLARGALLLALHNPSFGTNRRLRYTMAPRWRVIRRRRIKID